MDEAIQKKLMDEVEVEKTWQVPEHNGQGPVTITMRLPSVTITDSEGRSIRIAPQQAAFVSVLLGNVGDWMTSGADEWIDGN